MSILVTGGAGFIGSHYVRMLLDQTDLPVVMLDNFNDYYDPKLKRDNASRQGNRILSRVCQHV